MVAKKQHPGRIGLASVFLRTILALSVRLVVSPFKGSKGASTYFKDVLFTALRTQLRNVSLEQSHYLNTPTDESYLIACKTVKFEPDSIILQSGIKAHWIGNKNADKLIIFFLGGGYCVPATPPAFEYLFDLQNTMNALGHDCSIITLSYSLGPEQVYPMQLREAVELLKHILALKQWGPSKITIGGDSAGANLALGLLSHLLHPHPDIEALTVPEPLNAAFLFSPWINFQYNQPSFARNAERDAVDAATLTKWADAFLSGAKSGDHYSEPGLAPPSWWNGLEKVVSEVLIWGGDWEVLIDGIREFAGKFQEGYGGNCEVMYGERAAHEEMILDRIIGIKAKPKSALDVEGWISARL